MVPAEVPSYWQVYFAVDDVDGAFKKAIDAGARELQPPQDFPGGRFAIVSRPTGREPRPAQDQPPGLIDPGDHVPESGGGLASPDRLRAIPHTRRAMTAGRRFLRPLVILFVAGACAIGLVAAVVATSPARPWVPQLACADVASSVGLRIHR